MLAMPTFPAALTRLSAFRCFHRFSSSSPSPRASLPTDARVVAKDLYHTNDAFSSLPQFSEHPDLTGFGDGYVASVSLVGPPNAGKSSLSNALIKHRVSAVSRKVNTTRSCPTGVYTHPAREKDGGASRQLMLCDTPGLVERAFLSSLRGDRRAISSAAWGTAIDTDFALFVVDATRSKNYLDYYARVATQLANFRHSHFSRAQQQYLDFLQNQTENVEDEEQVPKPTIVENQPLGNCILVLNKSDVVRPAVRLLAVQDFLTKNIPDFESHFHSKVFVTSAFRGRGVDELRNYLLDAAPRSELIASPGTSFLDQELDVIRQHIWEKLLHRVHQEVPYRCMFENDVFHVAPNGDLLVSEIIRAPSRSACYIIVGNGGEVLRWIKKSAEQSASQVLGKKVRLKLKVLAQKRQHIHAR